MRLLDPARALSTPVDRLENRDVASVHVGSGCGESHVYQLTFAPGGEIGPHRADFDQILLVLEGAGWAAGRDGVRVSLSRGQAALFALGEMHSKGSDRGMAALMIQIRDFEPAIS
jgi:quercetin dioxygenase-like cupin family protein